MSHLNVPEQSVSCDTLYDGDIICYQHQNGYRFSIDSVLLANFLTVRRDDKLLELGGGCGVVSLIILYRWLYLVGGISAIEIQPALAELARQNFVVNGFEEKATSIEGDIREIKTLVGPESYDMVISNPPFYLPSAGRMNRNREAQQARHQLNGKVVDFFAAAAFAVKNGGSFFCIYPADRVAELLAVSAIHKLIAKKIQFIYSYPDDNMTARLVLTEFKKNGGEGMEVLPPFYIYGQRNGDYSSEMKRFYKKKHKDRTLFKDTRK